MIRFCLRTRIRCSLVGELRVPARVSSLSVQPSPLSGRVGIHIVTFQACSSFTRVTACRVAHPPYVGFITRLRPCRLPSSDARKLPSSTNNLLGWVFPPLVICAVEALPRTPLGLFAHYRKRRQLSYFRKSLFCLLASFWMRTSGRIRCQGQRQTFSSCSTLVTAQ